MNADLDRLAAAYGILDGYVGQTGEFVRASEETKIALLESMGVLAGSPEHIAQSLAHAPARTDHAPHSQCFVPPWLADGRVWGITTQLYALRSRRNLGIGDFEDLANLCDICAAVGADFVGINPVHTLFLSDPERCSPYFPSHRQFLNPLYIAVDRIAGEMHGALNEPVARLDDLIDYPAVAAAKLKRLRDLFAAGAGRDGFEDFRRARGAALQQFAVFESLSAAMSARGLGSGWQGWPEAYRHCTSSEVREFASEHEDDVAFHAWLQWIATSQLSHVQRRARAAGMRIGLYLDLAVGVAPDGAATWSDPHAVVRSARIGCPPDLFNAHGQDWGLAPLSPTGMEARHFEPFIHDIEAQLGFAGALRIDHVMGLERLYWIPGRLPAAQSGYVRYPREQMLAALAAVSHKARSIIVGEDLGTVPEGFRERMRAAEVQSYRVMMFERGHDGAFSPPHWYPREALTCAATHDLATLAGWWRGEDIALRSALGLADETTAALQSVERAQERQRLQEALTAAGVVEGGAPTSGEELPESVLIGAHRFLARAPSRLMVAQLEDLTGTVRQMNLPGTDREYPNWRQTLPMCVEDLAADATFQAVTRAIAQERPRAS